MSEKVKKEILNMTPFEHTKLHFKSLPKSTQLLILDIMRDEVKHD